MCSLFGVEFLFLYPAGELSTISRAWEEMPRKDCDPWFKFFEDSQITMDAFWQVV